MLQKIGISETLEGFDLFLEKFAYLKLGIKMLALSMAINHTIILERN